jgi:hypothetical protein
MAESAFPSKVAAALDRLTVPPLPPGFADRLVARIDAGVLPAEADASQPPLPTPRRAFGSGGWQRSARIVGVVSAFGLATATAAASGFFGEPVYVPVVSETLAKAKLVELPRRAATPQPAVAKPQPASSTPKQATPEPPKGQAAVHDLYTKLRSDPEFTSLPRRERVAKAKAEVQQMLRDGTMTRAELMQGLREIRAEQAPAVRAKIDAEVQRRVENGTLRPQAAERIERRLDQAAARQAEPREPPPLEVVAQRREAYRQLLPEQQARLRELRQLLRSAPPAERPAIRREIRAIWQAAGRPQGENNSETGEGNPEPIR